MNTLIQESIKYAANTNTHKYESIQDALADAYAHGRLAKPLRGGDTGRSPISEGFGW